MQWVLGLVVGLQCTVWPFNVNVDLNYFNNIVPCGITNKGVTSLNLEVGSGC